jgi:3-hydroxy-9,10-secoandrosta-1,3,5(10)-triene-9,17-dione monooxygenase
MSIPARSSFPTLRYSGPRSTDSTDRSTSPKGANLIDSAQLHLTGSARLIDEAAAAGQLPFVERARLRMDVAHAVRSARQAAELLVTVSGPGSLAGGMTSQRFWRDLEAGSRHPYFNDGVAGEIYGRALAGIDEQITGEAYSRR